MIRPAVLFFFQFATLASPGRFIPLFLSWYGLSDAAVGAVLAAPSAVTLLSLVGGGVLADAIPGGRLMVLAAGNAVSFVAFQAMLGVHLLPVGGVARLVAVAVAYMISRVARVPTFPVLDAYTLEYLAAQAGNGDDGGGGDGDGSSGGGGDGGNFCGDDDVESDGNGNGTATTTAVERAQSRYGRERLWGAISWGITSAALGVALDTTGFGVVFLFNTLSSACLGVALLGGVAPEGGGLRRDGFADRLLQRLGLREGWTAEGSEDADALVGAEMGEVRGDAPSVAATAIAPGEVAVKGMAPPAGARLPTTGASGGSGSSSGSGCKEAAKVRGVTEDGEAPPAQAPPTPSLSREDVVEFCRHLAADPPTVAFFLAIAVINAGTSLVENLVFLFFAHDLGASNSLCGLAVVITVIFEIPLFYVSDWLLARYSGRTLLLTGTFCYVTRVVVYTLVGAPHAWRVLAVEPLHGVTYALVQMASVREVARRAPPRLAATAQSVLAVAANVGTIAGTAGGGAVMQRWGAVTAYRGAAAAVTVAAAIYAGLTLRWEAAEGREGGGNRDACSGRSPARVPATELIAVGD
ncbi:hypothetical protein MMPV_000283 [Pyropia vietnamensis]